MKKLKGQTKMDKIHSDAIEIKKRLNRHKPRTNKGEITKKKDDNMYDYSQEELDYLKYVDGQSFDFIKSSAAKNLPNTLFLI